MELEKSHVQRLLGIDLFRGIAAYGVVLIHGLGDIHRDAQALFISDAFVSFCVPFFLVTAFYFSNKLLTSKGTKKYIINRINRILLPYFAWTLIYVLVRYIGALIGNKQSFARLISDPFNIIFFGAAGVQLYFLPLLFCGTLAVIPLCKILRNLSSTLLFILFLLSIYLFYLMTITGNDFALGQGVALRNILNISSLSQLSVFPLIRLITVALAWTIRCIPYIIFSILFNKCLATYLLKNHGDIEDKNSLSRFILIMSLPVFIVIILCLNIKFLQLFLPYLSFLYAIWISRFVSQSQRISQFSLKIGYFSYGVYLSHALITASFLPIMVKIYPKITTFELSPLMLFLSATIIFTLSLAITYLNCC